MLSRRRVFVYVLLGVLALCATFSYAARKKKAAEAAGMDDQQRALHALNRLTFGPRPGDLQRVMAVGVDKWIEQQLHPDKIDDSALEARLVPLRTLKMDTRAMLEHFPPPQVVKAVENGKMNLPSNPEQRAIYEAQMERMRAQQENKQDASADPTMMTDEQKQARREERQQALREAESLMQLPPDQRMKQILRMDPRERRMIALRLPEPDRERIIADMTPQQRETILALVNPQQVVVGELQQGKLLRAAYSERQLQEVMTDFWFNHFNVFIGKGPDRYMLTGYERDVIRPHALGKFKDLLVATAKSPAMLFYLDNWQSVGPNSEFALGGPRQARRNEPRPRARMGMRCGIFGCRPVGGVGARVPAQRPRNPQAQQQAKRQRSGLNENYARELMELHTLGVDGGYTQKDVTEVARVFTGWTLKEPRLGGEFDFNPRMHEPGPKRVLGREIKEHGEDEGTQILDMLAHHPSTAHFISKKLAQRFVSDDPPEALVQRMAQTFTKSDGDIREVLRTMFRSPEFWSANAYRAKVKTPLEFVVSAVRASGADVQNAMPLVQTLNRMGMPLYGSQPPTGYSIKAETWVNSSALLNRMNFALGLAAGRLPGTTVDPGAIAAAVPPSKDKHVQAAAALPNDAEGALAALEQALLAGDISRQTHDTIRKQLNDPQVTGRALDDGPRPPNTAVITGLILGSPEFQRR